MRENFQHELQLVISSTLSMLGKVKTMLHQAEDILIHRKAELMPALSAADKEVDEQELRIENECLKLIALHQPVAIDLRMIGTFLKNLSDIERMGDYLVHVAEDGVLLAQEAPLKKYVNLAQMLGRLDTMLGLLMQAIEHKDLTLAHQALQLDNEVDELYEQTQRELVTYMIEDPRTITKAMTLMRVGRSLERVGDHIENVAERLQYWVTGQRYQASTGQ